MTVATQSLSEDTSVVAFYGINHSASAIEAYYRMSLRWFESLGLEPDKMGLSGDGQSESVTSFSRTSKKLLREGFERVAGFEVYATEPDAKVFWSDCIASADYEGKKSGTHAFLTVRQSLAKLDNPSLAQFVGEMAKLLKPAYGVGFSRQKKFGPGFFAIGILKGLAGYIPTDEEYEEELRVCRWGDIGMPEQVYQQGLIRDVFPLNFLTAVHLEKRIDGTQLRNWIAQDACRGKVSPISDEMWDWSITPEQVQPIRQSLQKAEIIFDWKKWSK